MHRRRTFPLTWLVFLLLLCASATPSRAQVTRDITPPAQKLTVILLGTGGGPPINLESYEPSTLVVAGGQLLLFDCGRGATFRLAQAGIPLQQVTKIFLTHLHSDHIVQLPDLLLTPWTFARAPGGPRIAPLEIWGPAGTRDMMDNMLRTFAYDIHIRRDVDEHFSADGIRVISHDIEQGTVYEKNGVKVIAFNVDHGPVKPAFGYRVEYGGHSVVLSGDTRFSENLIRFAQGTDVLVHEVLDPEVWSQALHNEQTRLFAERVVSHHTLPEQAGEIFARVKPKLAVYYHAISTPELLAKTRKTYGGPLELGEDLMTIEIGDTVEVRRRPH